MRKRSKKYSPPKLQEKLLFPELKAAQLLEQGEAQQALQVAVRALAEGRRNPDLSNIAGVCAAAMGDDTLASQLWQHAVELSPHYAQAWFNLGLFYEKRSQLDEAERHYLQAVELDPQNLDTLLLLSNLLMQQGRTDDAERWLQQALVIAPEHAQANNNLGLALASRRQFDVAEQHYRRAMASEASDMSAWVNLGMLLAATGRQQEAETVYETVLAAEPDNVRALTNSALLLESLKRPQEAEARHRKALEHAPDSVEILSNLANLLSAQRRETEAESLFQQALAINPESAVTHTNLGVLLANSKRDNEAEQSFNRALDIKPDYLLPRLNLSYLQLAQGRFAEGWPNHEARFDPQLPDNGIPLPPVSASQWRGEELNGKSLLVWVEQGYGDLIQFARYVPLIKQRWNVRITLVCRPALQVLFETLHGVDVLLAADVGLVLPDHFDYWALPLSMPGYCGTLDVDSIPADIPYLAAAPQRMARWQSAATATGFKVGLVWQGNLRHHNNPWRSLPGPEQFLPLLDVAGVHFFSLQPDADAAVAPAFFQHPAMTDLGKSIEDFADTAAIVAQLDLVICVDTAIAHLAGALGKACWLMLPYYRTDWRWLQNRSDTPWYPTLRLFRQGSDEAWEPVIQNIKHELRAKTSG